jgi:hypothetical protein
MNNPTPLLIVGLGCLILSGPGCKNKSEVAVDASEPLVESFQAAEPQTQQAIQNVAVSLQTADYAEATRALAPIVTGGPLTDPQKQAVGLALQQVNQAIAADPSLDTKEMYELRKKMFDAVHRGPRF